MLLDHMHLAVNIHNVRRYVGNAPNTQPYLGDALAEAKPGASGQPLQLVVRCYAEAAMGVRHLGAVYAHHAALHLGQEWAVPGDTSAGEGSARKG
jgi:hypothetical protein